MPLHPTATVYLALQLHDYLGQATEANNSITENIHIDQQSLSMMKAKF